MKHKVNIVLSLVLLVALVSLVACQPADTTTAPATVTKTAAPVTVTAPAATQEPEPEPEFTWPKSIDVQVSGPAGAMYGQTIAWGTPFTEDTGCKVRVVSVDLGVNRYRYLKEGRFFTSALSWTHDISAAALPEYTARDLGPGDFRIWYPLSVYYNGYVVRGDSDINTPYDLKGKKVAYYPHFGPPGEALVQALLDWAELDKDDVTWVPVSGSTDIGPGIRDGKFDVGMTSTIDPQWYEVEASPHGLKWIPLDFQANPEAAARFEATFPAGIGWGEAKVGVPTAIGVPMMEVIALQSTTAQFDTELVYNLIKWLDENYDIYKDGHPNFGTMTPEFLLRASETNYIPLHEGAVQYLKEKGMWTDKHQARQEQNIKLLDSWVQLFAAAVDKADDQGILVSTENEEWLKFWESERQNSGLPKFTFFKGLD